MRVAIDPRSQVPPSEQLREQLTTLVIGGELAASTRLPSIRQLAADLGLAPGTVARAYSALEEAGLVVTNGPRGSRVAPRPSPDAAVTRAADAYLAAGRRTGLDVATLVALLRTRAG